MTVMCPNCDKDITGNIEWNEEPELENMTVKIKGKCPNCGKPLEQVFTDEGIFDPENWEYIERH